MKLKFQRYMEKDRFEAFKKGKDRSYISTTQLELWIDPDIGFLTKSQAQNIIDRNIHRINWKKEIPIRLQKGLTWASVGDPGIGFNVMGVGKPIRVTFHGNEVVDAGDDGSIVEIDYKTIRKEKKLFAK